MRLRENTVPEQKATALEPAVSHRRARGTNGGVEGRGGWRSRSSPIRVQAFALCSAQRLGVFHLHILDA